MNRIVWVFREQRSGSTWFTTRLANHLSRESHFFDIETNFTKIRFNEQEKFREKFFTNRVQQKEDINKILNTHDFLACKGLQNYENPIVFRVSRKNKIEQFFSLYLANLSYSNNYGMNIWSTKELENCPKYDNIIVSKKDIDFFIKVQKKNDFLWKSFANMYDTEIVYYEDLLETYTSKVIPDVSFSLKNNYANETLTVKLPYNKKEIFLNYDFVEKYICKELKI
jgi:hypothetical protein